MAAKRTISDIGPWFEARVQLQAEREAAAWAEYLRTVRAASSEIYEQSEPLAWRRLRRALAELSHDRRRLEFERDRALAELSGLRLAS